ncbi:MAG: hypothetical protein D6762_08380 [Candidatus Neomarinimicrobiota bacterium]|nr:MAG: hypothetical protein D6762_08380 [Candidatus Neomarinimicrobiota bacterium]
MNFELFYTAVAEGLKALLYVIFLVMIGIALLRRKQGRPTWTHWIHAVVFLNFIIGGLYGGIRMLTTDPHTDMFLRRMFAWEAWFCFAVASFYFLGLLHLKQKS